ncbi:hypothetical protein GCM10010129_07860 [Streptomyces fumigatiscleroticus]|nr:hypothetical protein GCM10010129_07860 [Streptomyces fumigatiscleroticus]
MQSIGRLTGGRAAFGTYRRGGTGARGQEHDLIAEHGVPGKRLVDLRCGTGKAALRLAASGFEVTGVDLSPI